MTQQVHQGPGHSNNRISPDLVSIMFSQKLNKETTDNSSNNNNVGLLNRNMIRTEKNFNYKQQWTKVKSVLFGFKDSVAP